MLVFSLLVAAVSAQLIPGSWIVRFKKSVTEANADALIKVFGIEPKYRYKHVYQGFAGAMSDETVSRIRAHPSIYYIEQDQLAHAIGPMNKSADAACASQTADVDWGQARMCQPGSAPAKGTRYNYDDTAGQGVAVYVLDTGILLTHVDFQGRARFGYKAEAGWSDTDGNGHGTHVASEIVGVTWGLAKKAQVTAVKVLSDQGSGSYAGVVAGVDWTYSQFIANGGPTVSNMSLGGGPSQALDDAVDALAQAGSIIAVAAGNSNANACNYSPARAPDALTVGSTDWTAAAKDVRSSFSNWGTCVDVFGPGSNIKAAWIGSNTATNTISGTSMASPHVAGAATLIWGQNPTSTAADIEAQLLQLANSGVIANVGTGSPNLLAFTGCDC